MKTPDTMNGRLILKQCCICHEWLDKKSKEIAETRKKTEYVISHGLCEKCFEKTIKENEGIYNVEIK